MEGPKSVELSVIQVRDIAEKVAKFKGKPPERVAPRKILDAIKALPEMPNLDAFRKEAEACMAGVDAAADEPAKKIAQEALDKTNLEFRKAYSEWLAKPVFLPVDKADRAFIWNLYEKEFKGDCDLPREDWIVDLAKALGKSGACTDLLAEAIEEAEKIDKGEDDDPVLEDVKPELVK